MEKYKKLENPKCRHKLLDIIRKTGMISQGFKAAGVSEPTLHRYRQSHPEFDQAILDAVQFYHLQQELDYGIQIRRKALTYFEELIDTKEINHAVLYKFLFERDNRCK